ncbi:MAG: hypothetical protein IT211_13145 [Armatimonadetes bacterium]|nr:hypothetical protein [Armatimonadota bacterium]
MSKRLFPVLLLLVLLSPFTLLATQVTEARWNGDDVVITFSDSVRYQVDLAETDSMVVVIRFPATTIAADAKLRQLRNRNNRAVGFSPLPDGGLRLTLTSRSRFGYSTLWRPFTNRLIVHTFDWNGLPYNQEQYHKGLLALEAGMTQQAEELLGVAYATGEQRAASVLGVMYARAGRDSLAARYLAAPADEDDRQALQQLAAQGGQSPSPSVTNSSNHPGAAEPPTSQTSPAGITPSTTSPSFMDTFNDWRVLVAVIGGLLLFAIALAILIRSSRKKPAPSTSATSVQAEEPAIRVARGPEPAANTTTVAAPPVTPTPTAPTPSQPAEAIAKPTPPVANSVPATQPVPETLEAVPTPVSVPVSAAPVASVQAVPVATPVAEISAEPVGVTAVSAGISTGVSTPAVAITEQTLKQPVGTLIESLSSAAIPVATPAAASAQAGNAPAEPATTTPQAESTEEPTAGQSRRMSGQALQLQQRIEAARRGEITVLSAEVPAVYEARRLNVSRDNVELRRRINDLQRKGA